MNRTIRYRMFQPADRKGLLELFHAVYGEPFMNRTSSWRYLDRPPDQVDISVAEADGVIVGAQPSHAIDLRIEGAATRGALLVDVMTHPSFRRRGVFAGVVEMLRRHCHQRGIRIVLTTPNEAAARGFARLPAWRRLGDLSPLVLPVDPSRLIAGNSAWGWFLRPLQGVVGKSLRRRLHAAAQAPIRWIVEPDRLLTPLLSEFTRSARCIVTRDEAFLRWRFIGAPEREYRFLLHGSGAGCEGLAITSRGTLLGREVLYLVELIVTPGITEIADDLIAGVVRQAVTDRVAAIVGYFPPHSPLVDILRRSGFWHVAGPLRPRAYSIWGATDFDAPLCDVVSSLDNWHMSLADSDLG